MASDSCKYEEEEAAFRELYHGDEDDYQAWLDEFTAEIQSATGLSAEQARYAAGIYPETDDPNATYSLVRYDCPFTGEQLRWKRDE